MNLDEMQRVHEGAAKEEVDAFFALPRKRLYLSLLLAVILLAVLFCSAMLLARVDWLVFMLPTATAVGAGITWLLRWIF